MLVLNQNCLGKKYFAKKSLLTNVAHTKNLSSVVFAFVIINSSSQTIKARNDYL